MPDIGGFNGPTHVMFGHFLSYECQKWCHKESSLLITLFIVFSVSHTHYLRRA